MEARTNMSLYYTLGLLIAVKSPVASVSESCRSGSKMQAGCDLDDRSDPHLKS
jgi:hypothetical protein